MIAALLNTDFVIPAALFMVQLEEVLVDAAPDWALPILFGIFITLWFLKEIGRLPGTATQGDIHEDRDSTAGFTSVDGERLEKLYYLLAERNAEGVERYLKLAQEARAANQVQEEILAELRTIAEELRRSNGHTS